MQYSPDLISEANPSVVEQYMELKPDVQNPLYDLLVQDEELEAAAKRGFDDLEHMMSRLSGLDESHPAFEPLVEIVNSQVWGGEQGSPEFANIARSAGRQYRYGLEAVQKLNEHQFLPPALWLVSLAGVASSVATGIPVGSAAAGAMVGNGAGRAGSRIRDTRGSLGSYLSYAHRLHACREEFDTIYARMVCEDRDPDDLSEAEL